MFVTQSKYNDAVASLNALARRFMQLHATHDRLLDRWNALIERINAAGGEEALERMERGPKHAFTDEDFTRLLNLIHPDKHGGKQAAKEMTQKVLELRKALRD